METSLKDAPLYKRREAFVVRITGTALCTPLVTSDLAWALPVRSYLALLSQRLLTSVLVHPSLLPPAQSCE